LEQQKQNNIQQQKLSLIKWIEEIDDLALIQQLHVLKNKQSNGEDLLTDKDIELIKKGTQQAKNGQTTSYQTMMKPYEKYLQGFVKNKHRSKASVSAYIYFPANASFSFTKLLLLNCGRLQNIYAALAYAADKENKVTTLVV